MTDDSAEVAGKDGSSKTGDEESAVSPGTVASPCENPSAASAAFASDAGKCMQLEKVVALAATPDLLAMPEPEEAPPVVWSNPNAPIAPAIVPGTPFQPGRSPCARFTSAA